MLHFRQENDVSFANKFSAPCLSHQIDALSGPTREDDFICARRADVFCNTPPRLFVSLGRARAQSMQSTMDICIVMLIKFRSASITTRGFCEVAALAIEIDQRMAMCLFAQNRENLREGFSNPQCWQQPCAHHNLLRLITRATYIQETQNSYKKRRFPDRSRNPKEPSAKRILRFSPSRELTEHFSENLAFHGVVRRGVCFWFVSFGGMP